MSFFKVPVFAIFVSLPFLGWSLPGLVYELHALVLKSKVWKRESIGWYLMTYHEV